MSFFNTSDEAPGLAIAQVDVVYLRIGKHLLNPVFQFSISKPLFCEQRSVRSETFEHQRNFPQCRVKIIVRRKGYTRLFVNEDRSGRRIGVNAIEWVIGEENAFLLSFPKRAQAQSAGTVAACYFHLSRVAVLRRFQVLTNLSREVTGNRDELKCLHELPPSFDRMTGY